jgi:hypothetical protein
MPTTSYTTTGGLGYSVCTISTRTKSQDWFTCELLDTLLLKGFIEEQEKDDKGNIQYIISIHGLQWKLE